jgi:hypothetical protein
MNSGFRGWIYMTGVDNYCIIPDYHVKLLIYNIVYG